MKDEDLPYQKKEVVLKSVQRKQLAISMQKKKRANTVNGTDNQKQEM